MNANIWAATLVAGLIVNGIWYYIKYILQQNGYETHMFWGHGQDILHLHQLAGQEQDADKKRQFRMLLLTFYIVTFITFAGFFMFMFFNMF